VQHKLLSSLLNLVSFIYSFCAALVIGICEDWKLSIDLEMSPAKEQQLEKEICEPFGFARCFCLLGTIH